jgi:Helix-turn-helix domain
MVRISPIDRLHSLHGPLPPERPPSGNSLDCVVRAGEQMARRRTARRAEQPAAPDDDATPPATASLQRTPTRRPTRTSPPTSTRPTAQSRAWGPSYRWALERLAGESQAAHLYGWLAARYGHPQNAEHPTRLQLAQDMGISVRAVQRAINVLRQRGILKTTSRRQPGTGYVIGTTYALVTPIWDEDEEESLSATDGTQAQYKESLSATGGTQAATLSATGGIQGALQGEPECQNEQSLSATGGTAKIRSDQIRSTYGGGGDQQDLARVTNGDNSSQPDPEPHPLLPPRDGPTNAECREAFYARWEIEFGAPCDQLPSDSQKMHEVMTKARDRVLDVINGYFLWPDPFCKGKHLPMALLAQFTGTVLAWLGKPALVPIVAPHPADTDRVLNDPVKRAEVNRLLRELRTSGKRH